MLAGLTSQELTEIEAYSRVEADPEGEEGRKEKQRIADAEALERLKRPFTRVLEATHGDGSNP